MNIDLVSLFNTYSILSTIGNIAGLILGIVLGLYGYKIKIPELKKEIKKSFFKEYEELEKRCTLIVNAKIVSIDMKSNLKYYPFVGFNYNGKVYEYQLTQELVNNSVLISNYDKSHLGFKEGDIIKLALNPLDLKDGYSPDILENSKKIWDSEYLKNNSKKEMDKLSVFLREDERALLKQLKKWINISEFSILIILFIIVF